MASQAAMKEARLQSNSRKKKLRAKSLSPEKVVLPLLSGESLNLNGFDVFLPVISIYSGVVRPLAIGKVALAHGLTAKHLNLST
ncbi:hypothetical protein Tco_0129592 [Tanacetum coccineum]